MVLLLLVLLYVSALVSADTQLLAVQLLDGRHLLVLEEPDHGVRGHQLVQVRQQRGVVELSALDQEQHAPPLDALEHLFERRGEGLFSR